MTVQVLKTKKNTYLSRFDTKRVLAKCVEKDADKTCSDGDCPQNDEMSKTRISYGLVVVCLAAGSGNEKKEVKNVVLRHLP